MNTRVLITGGAGFIGSHLADALISRGYRVTVLDDLSTGSRENLADAQSTGRLRLIEGSVLDPSALGEATEDCARVFHLAVQCVRRSLGRPIENHAVNATGTILTLEAARRAGVQRFIYCSSSEVYGNAGSGMLSEDTTQCAPSTVYGAAKLAGEYYSKAYQQAYGLPALVVRPFNAYGPREHTQGELAEVIPRFIIRLLNEKPPIIFGNGEAGRDFTYVTEVAAGLAAAGDCDALIGATVNIAFGRIVTVRRVAELLARMVGRPNLRPEFLEPRPGDVMSLHADVRRAQELLRFSAKIDIETGLARYLEWFRGHHPNFVDLLEDNPRNWCLPESTSARTSDFL